MKTRTQHRIALLCICVGLNSCSVQTVSTSSESVEQEIQSIDAEACHPLPQPKNHCDVTFVDSSHGAVIFGDVLTEQGVIRNGSVSIDSAGKISFVGCQSVPADRTSINCSGSIVSPGLINAHDHLKYNQNPPGGLGESLYSHCNNNTHAYADPSCKRFRFDRRNQWRKGLDDKYKVIAPGTRDNAIIVWSELRHIIAGTTTVAGSGGAKGLVRNPDVDSLTEGLVTRDEKFVDYETFPLGDTTDVEGHTDTCQYPNIVSSKVLENLVFLPHVAEGVDSYAHNEILCLTARGTSPSDPGVNVAAANSAFVHGLATNEQDVPILASRGTSIVWSPRSNISLYGHTAPVTHYSISGINVALASDWTPSGSINLFRELQCASDYSETYLDRHFSSFDLWLMVTRNAAKALGVDDQIGAIKVGYWADIVILRNSGGSTLHDSFIGASPQDVFLTLRGGEPLYGEAELTTALNGSQCELLEDVCGSVKSVCLGGTGLTLDQLKASNQHSYQLAMCGNENLEPSCTPARYGEYDGSVSSIDFDGDGITNDADNCPRIFNPPRPMDFGKQIEICAY